MEKIVLISIDYLLNQKKEYTKLNKRRLATLSPRPLFFTVVTLGNIYQ